MVDLIEREGDLRTLGDQVDAGRRGDGSLTVVEGPAGIGKTSLLDAACAHGRELGMRVLRARGGVLEQELEYGVVRQLLERPLRLAPEPQRTALLAGPAAAAAGVLGLGPVAPDLGPGRDPAPDIWHGLAWLVTNLAANEPLLICLDDAHWGDTASMRAGGYLARRIGGLPVAIVVGVRDDEPGSGHELLGQLFGAADPIYVRPEPFSVVAVARTLADAFGDAEPGADLVAACAHASRGNPFLCLELARELAAGHTAPAAVGVAEVQNAGPLAVRRALLLRLGRLGGPATRLARALAVLGGDGELRHAAAVAGLEAGAAAQAADLLVGAGLLAPERPLRLVHPIVRAAIAEDTPPSDRARGHRAALEVLRAEALADDRLLVHASSAEPAGDPAVVALLRRAAQRNLGTGAPRTAAGHLTRALAEPPGAADRPGVLAELGRAEVRGGGFEMGLAHLDEALGALDDPVLRLAVHRDRAFAAFAARGMVAAREIVRGSLAGTGGDDALQLEVDLALLAWLSGAEHGLDLRRHRDVDGDTRAQRTVLALLAQEEHARGAPPDAVVELARRALGGGRLVEHDTSEALSWYMAVYALLTCEAHADARATIEHALADGRRRGSVFARAGALGTRAVLALNEGRPLDAEADARTAARAIPPAMAAVNGAYVVLALTDQGDLDGAGDALRAGGLEHGPGGPTVMRWVPWARARLREAQGDARGARDDVQCLREDETAGAPMRALAWRALLARVLARGPDAGEAAALAEAHLGWARSWGRAGALGVAERAVALAAAPDRRGPLLERAVETLAASDLGTEEARARADLGVAWLRAGRRRDGRAALEGALELALQRGMRRTGRAVAAELEVAGAPPQRLRFDELTASERRVAEMAASGLTNRDIAEELFVTVKTVENHLTRVYGKLGVRARGELAPVL